MGRTVLHYDTCGSTQEELKKWALGSDVLGWVILADRQSDGRGQHQRKWADLGGQQLFMSMSVPFLHPVQWAPIMNIWVAVVIFETLQHQLPHAPLAIKWPNDLYISDQKLGGILSELWMKGGTPQIHVGCGLNLSETQSSNDFSHTSLETHGLSIAPERLAQNILKNLDQSLMQPDFEKIGAHIEKTFLQHSLHRDQIVQVADTNGIIEGKMVGLSKEGGLLLETRKGDRVLCITGTLSAIQKKS